MATPTPAAVKVPAEDALLGRTLGKYQLLRLVGEGGMGKVYEAVNTTIHKRVALKCIDRELADNEDAVARFQREALAASRVDSPYIVQIFDAGQDDGIPYIVMELLRGRDLGSLLTERGRLSPADAVVVTRQVLKGLAQAHEAGIVHRDLKPDNVFLVAHDGEPARVKLLDFGVSKIARSGSTPLKTLTKQGMVVGTPHYMSPEQAQAMPDVDRRTDLYSVGAMLYECLAGRPPHQGDSYEQVIVRICMHDATDIRTLNDEVSAELAAVLHKALAREPAARFSTAREMLAALAELGPVTSLPGIDLAGAQGVTQPQTPAFADTQQASSADQLPPAGDKHSGVKPLERLEAIPASEAVPLPPRHSLLPWIGVAALLLAAAGMGVFVVGSNSAQLDGAAPSATATAAIGAGDTSEHPTSAGATSHAALNSPSTALPTLASARTSADAAPRPSATANSRPPRRPPPRALTAASSTAIMRGPAPTPAPAPPPPTTTEPQPGLPLLTR